MATNTPTASGTRHGLTGLVSAVCLAVASYYDVPEIYSVPVCTAVAGFLGGFWRRFLPA